MNAAGFPDYLLNGLIPFNSGVPDANGCYWYMEGEMAGWDSPDGRVTMLTKIGAGPNADGEYPADQHYRGRTLQWTMYASCPTEIARENSRYLLAQALDLVDQTGLLVVNENIPKQVVIRRSGNSQQGKLIIADSGLAQKPTSTPDFPTANPDAKGLVYPLKAEVEVYCTDPRKYPITPSSATVSGGFASLDNVGNTATQNMLMTITSGISGSLLTLALNFPPTVLELVVPTIPASAPPLSPMPAELILDIYNGTIKDGSGNNFYYLRNMRTPWPLLPAGVHVMGVSGGLNIDGAVIQYFPAWI